VSYHRPENMRRCSVEKNNLVVRQLEKTREERSPDLAQLQTDREREIAQQKKQHFQLEAKKQREVRKQQLQEKEERSYDTIMLAGNMKSNAEIQATADATAAEEYEDDFF